MRLLKLILISSILVVGYFAITDKTSSPIKTYEKPKMSKEESQRITSVSVFGQMVKSNLKNPKSVEWVKITSNESGKLVCFTYRAENSFGATDIGRTAILYGSKVNWNDHCANKELYDMTYAKRSI